MKIVVDEKIPYLTGVLDPFVDVEYHKGNLITHNIVKDSDALLIRTRTKCNADLLKGTNVKFIASATIGYDHIDTNYCNKNGIFWTNAPGCNSGSVMQFMAAAILSYAKENNIDLQECVLGVIGVGNVGKKVVRFAECIGLQVLLNDPPRERKEGTYGFISLEGILREADIITLHVPLNRIGNDRTYHLVNDRFLSKMNKGSLLINTSRGEVVNTEALKKALKAGLPSSAIIDVWENEPEIDTELLGLSYIATPHIAGYSADGKSTATAMIIQTLSKFFDLGLDDWEPAIIPEPKNKILHYNAKNKSLQEIITDLVMHTYDIKSDDKSLRASPTDFEQIRVNYPLRREFWAYKIIASNLSLNDRKVIMRLGFNVN
jgi:erythronate-4-phosphate dehydrogenase